MTQPSVSKLFLVIAIDLRVYGFILRYRHILTCICIARPRVCCQSSFTVKRLKG